MRHLNKKGQAIVEIGVFGAIVIFVFGVLLNYVQQLNNQQYVRMDTFRRALEKANTAQPSNPGDGAGASVQYIQLENRHNIEMGGGFKKGSSQLSASAASVFWAVPKVEDGVEPENLIAFKVNEDERVYNYRDYITKDEDAYDDKGKEKDTYYAFSVGDGMISDSRVVFDESSIKSEDEQAITNDNSSTLDEKTHTFIPAKKVFVTRRPSGQDDIVQVVQRGDDANQWNWDLNQKIYRDQDGQYKYSQDANDKNAVVSRQEIWQTNF